MSKEKNSCDTLKEKLFNNKKNSFFKLSDDEIKTIDTFCEDYKIFLNEAKTEREAVEYSIKLAKEKGFTEFDAKKSYKPNDKVFYNNRNKSVIFTVFGKDDLSNGVLIAAAHVDSPRLDLKPCPVYESDELALFKTHYYGGIKKYQWPALPLALHGIIIKNDMSKIKVSLGENEDEPKFCVTDLLPHLGKEQMAKPLSKAIDGENLNVLIGSRPFKSDEGSELVKLNILNLLYEKYNITESDFLCAELSLTPAFKACDIGFDKSMIGSYGQDDRVCAYSALKAILDCNNPKKTVITVLTDKEEIGSTGNTGLNSNYLRYFIADIANMYNLKTRHVLSKSKCLSADVNAAFDPNYSEVFETNNSCHLNYGTVLTKYTGSGGKFDASDASAEFMSEIRTILNNNKIIWQTGELGKVDAGGGGTVSQFVASLNVDVVDLGVPVLSMHSPFEVVSKIDTFMTYRAIHSFFIS